MLGGLGRQALPASAAGVHGAGWRSVPICTARARGTIGVNNAISTVKYKLTEFKPWFPWALLEQFRRAANVYYLVVSTLMVIGEQAPQLWDTPYESWSTAGVLGFVMAITAIKEGAEDLKRYQSDRKENSSQVLARTPDKRTVAWKDLCVGDLIVVRDRDPLPADAVLLTSSAANGVAYVDTANIDGETNLKIREAPLAVAKALGADPDAPVVGTVSVEPPNRHIHVFNGALRVQGAGEADVPLDTSSLLIRGCVLRNVEWALAVVVYTGKESKVALNSQATPSKMSLVEKTINKSLLSIAVPYLVFTTLSAGIGSLQNDQLELPYLHADEGGYVLPLFVSQWVTFFILYCYLIPVSLYVTIELVNLAQAWLITQDAKMYDPKTDTPALARSSNLCQELGQVQYVFSDKTGTLTANEMILRYVSLGGPQGVIAALPRNLAAADAGARADPNDPEAAAAAPVSEGDGAGPSGGPSASTTGGTALDVTAASMADVLRLGTGRPGGVSGPPAVPNGAASVRLSRSDADETVRARQTAEILALCNTVLPQRVGGDVVYQGESPDEVALVEAAASVGYRLIRRDGDDVTLAVGATAAQAPGPGMGGVCPPGSAELTVKVLAVNQFNSARKRMSVLVRYQDGSCALLCKGADTTTLPLLDQKASAADLPLAEEHLSRYAREGLRTLVVARRQLSSSQATEWLAKHKAATLARTDRDTALADAAAAAEVGMTLVAVTAIEDRLQDGVPRTLENLRRAGLKVWVLTGDKVETAVNIGYSCKLLTPDMTLLYVGATPDGSGPRPTRESLAEELRALAETYSAQIVASLPPNAAGSGRAIDADPTAELTATLAPGRPVQRDGAMSGMGGLMALVRGHHRGHASELAQSAHGSSKAAEVESSTLALVVDGATLAIILDDEELKKVLLHLGRICSSVLACRVSPKQKAQVVGLVKKGVRPEPLTLGIGDGANDVGMIQSAHVGVGISGKEGMQAVNNADFAIAQFRFLERLLLVHGRWNYTRMSKVVLYTYYKNFVLTLTLFVYQFRNAFSGTALYESLLASGFNVILFLPIVMVGAFDQDISADMATKHPELYVTGRTNMHLNTHKVLNTLFSGLLTGVVIVLVAGAGRQTYAEGGLYELGAVVFTWLFLIMQWKVAMETHLWTWPTGAVWAAHNVLYFPLVLGAYSYMLWLSADFYGVGIEAMSDPNFWLTSIAVVAGSACVDIALEAWRLQTRPTVVDVYSEIDAGYGDGTIEAAMQSTSALRRIKESLGLVRTKTRATGEGGRKAPTVPTGHGSRHGDAAPESAEAGRSSYDFSAAEVPMSKRADMHSANVRMSREDLHRPSARDA